MDFKKVLNKDSEDFKEIWRIYSYSFTADQRRELKKQIELFNNRLYSLFAVYNQNQLIGFIAIWGMNKFIFIEHFAVKKELREKGLGIAILKEYTAKADKNIVLEVERPETGAIAKRRIGFYERLGFKLNAYDYIQPPYSKDKKPLPLFLMTYPREISESEFLEVRKQVYAVVYSLKKPFLGEQT